MICSKTLVETSSTWFSRRVSPRSLPAEFYVIFLQPAGGLALYSVYRVAPKKKIGPARTIDHALILAEASGPGRYVVYFVGDAPKHVCFLTKHEDGTFTIDPRQAGSFTAVLHDTLTRA